MTGHLSRDTLPPAVGNSQASPCTPFTRAVAGDLRVPDVCFCDTVATPCRAPVPRPGPFPAIPRDVGPQPVARLIPLPPSAAFPPCAARRAAWRCALLAAFALAGCAP